MKFCSDSPDRRITEGRIQPFDEMPELISQLGQAGLRVFLVQGVFDIVHAGHTGLFQATRGILPANGVIVAGLENDETVRANKGDGRPVTTLDDRLKVVGEFRSVDFVFGYTGPPPRYDHPEDYLDRWRTLGPAAVVAASWDPHRDLKQWQADQTGVDLALVDYRHENSTTRMLRQIGYEE